MNEKMRQAILDNKKIDDAMKNFRIVPYSEVKERLDRATRETIEAVKKNNSTMENTRLSD